MSLVTLAICPTQSWTLYYEAVSKIKILKYKAYCYCMYNLSFAGAVCQYSLQVVPKNWLMYMRLSGSFKLQNTSKMFTEL